MALRDESWVRSLLISLGAFWLSLQVAIPLAYLFGKLTSGIIYSDSIFNTIAMGVMTPMGRAVAAALAAAIVTLSPQARSPSGGLSWSRYCTWQNLQRCTGTYLQQRRTDCGRVL